MPDYEYYCTACGHEFTVGRPIIEHAKRTACPKCGFTHCAKIASNFSVTFNGKGFYTTDHRGCDKNG